MPKRIQLSRTRGWRKPPGAVVVARPTKWGNPFSLTTYRTQHPELSDEQLRGLIVADFRKMLEDRRTGTAMPPSRYPTDDEIRTALAGRDLACWCPLTQPCHADVLLDLANRRPGNSCVSET